MEYEEVIERGSNVKVSSDLTLTKRRYGLDPEMVRMKNKIYKVEDIFSDENERKAVRMKGYTWAYEDVSIPTAEIPEQHFHFDVEVLTS